MICPITIKVSYSFNFIIWNPPKTRQKEVKVFSIVSLGTSGNILLNKVDGASNNSSIPHLLHATTCHFSLSSHEEDKKTWIQK